MSSSSNISKEIIGGMLFCNCEDSDIDKKMCEYKYVVKAQHFGNPKPYFWKINSYLFEFVSSGSIVEVVNEDTTEIVKVMSVLRLKKYNDTERKYHNYPDIKDLKEVIKVIRK